MTAKKDPLADALAQLQGSGSGSEMKVDAIFGDRPEVLRAIRDARQRKPPASFKAISSLLSADCRQRVSEGAVQNWCIKEGVG